MVGILLLPRFALAGEVPRNSCTPDIERYCETVEPGDGRILRCLQEHQPHLSANCQSTLEAANSKLAELRWTCAPDVIRLCRASLGTDRRGIVRCLQSHQAEISAPCSRGIQDLMGM